MGDEILAIVRPDSLADIFVYVIFFLGLGMLAAIPEKNTTSLYLIFAVIFFCIFDLLRQSDPNLPIPEADNCGFLTFMLHLGMGVFPWMSAGMSRRQGKKGGLVIPVGLLMGLAGLLYAFGAFFAPDVFYGTGGCAALASFA